MHVRLLRGGTERRGGGERRRRRQQQEEENGCTRRWRRRVRTVGEEERERRGGHRTGGGGTRDWVEDFEEQFVVRISPDDTCRRANLRQYVVQQIVLRTLAFSPYLLHVMQQFPGQKEVDVAFVSNEAFRSFGEAYGCALNDQPDIFKGLHFRTLHRGRTDKAVQTTISERSC